MKKLLKFSVPILIALLLFQWYTKEKYNLNIIDYWQCSPDINAWERSYLSQKGVLIYGFNENAAPLSFIDSNTGEVTGIVGDYISTLSIETGIPIEFKEIDMDRKSEALASNIIDITDFFQNEKNSNGFIHTQEIYKLEGAVIKNSSNTKIRKIRNLKGKTVAVISGDYPESVLSTMFDNDDINFYRVKNISQAILLIENDKVDAIAGDKMVIQYYLNNSSELKYSYEMLDEVLYSKSISLVVDKDDKMLLSVLNKSIFNIKKKNLLPQIQDKWLGTSGMITTDSKNYSWIPILFAGILILSLIFYIWEKFLRQKINAATSEIQEQKNSLRTIIDSVHFGLFVIDSNHTIIECNNEAIHITKTSYEKILGNNILELPVIGAMYKMYENNNYHNQKLKERYYYIDKHMVSEQLNTFIVFCEDITKRLMVEKELSQKNKMAAIGQLSAGLAHEIRNPLGLIKNYKYVINAYADDEISKHALSVIEDSVNRINVLIENLLKFSRLGNDMLTKFNISDTVNNLLVLEKKRAQQSNIILNITTNKLDSAFTNEDTFKIVVLNLVNNAIEALIDYETSDSKIVNLKISVESQKMTIKISDNGPGINNEKLENVFNPFYTTKDNGTGLGLYIVSTEIEKINGTINVESTENSGTSFTAIIPITEEQYYYEK